jgi:hypothetical protein
MAEQLLVERVTESLTRLRLTRMRESLSEFLQAAEREAWSPPEADSWTRPARRR